MFHKCVITAFTYMIDVPVYSFQLMYHNWLAVLGIRHRHKGNDVVLSQLSPICAPRM
jgi:hypothetical protein